MTSGDRGGAGSPVAEPQLDANQIQGDVLAGFRKNNEVFLFFEIEEVEAFRELLARLIPEIANLGQVAAFNDVYRLVRRGRRRGETGLSALWVNVALSATGLEKLGPPGTVLPEDESFRLGMARRARGGFLGDLSSPGKSDATETWKFGGTGTPVDGVLLLAGDDAEAVEARSRRLESEWLERSAIRITWSELCQARKDVPGHEHFGFRDGISQPGVRGRLSHPGRAFVTPRYISAEDPRHLRYARPGQRLVWPGEFVLGLPKQALPPADDLQPAPAATLAHPWLRNGSYLVVRRLDQDVEAFESFVARAAAALTAKGRPLDAAHLAAHLVGRWPSGAPLSRSPGEDSKELGGDEFAANDFGFVNPWGDPDSQAPPQLVGGADLPPDVSPTDDFPAAVADLTGLVCPQSAHVRKVNPRDQGTDIGGPANTLHRRLLRRGLPFGEPWTPETASAERGLMFASYQASIRDQFEFLIGQWVNRPNAPVADPGGIDLLIGGGPMSGKEIVLADADGGVLEEPVSGLAEKPWVAASGGGYFFAPSIAALGELAATH